jgi:uncharacterized phage infection (PIP) family protein YhgE
VQTVAEPAPNNTGRGAAPFYIALTVLLTSILGTAIVSQGIDVLNREAMAKGLKIGAAQTWRIKTALATAFCIPAAAIQTWIALGVLGIPASGWGSFLLFTLLCLLTISALTLFWITLAGPRGIVLTILFAIALGVPASGGTVPVQMLPDFYVWLHSWVPLRFVIDGFRAIILFHGRGDAGVSTATWVLLFDVCLCVVLAGAIALVKDARQRRSQVRMAAREPELAGTV